MLVLKPFQSNSTKPIALCPFGQKRFTDETMEPPRKKLLSHVTASVMRML